MGDFLLWLQMKIVSKSGEDMVIWLEMKNRIFPIES